MTAPSERIFTLRRMYDTEREAARTKAIDKLSGPKPVKGGQKVSLFNEWPRLLVQALTALLVVVLLAALVTSGFRLKRAGTQAFCAGWQGQAVVNPDTEATVAPKQPTAIECHIAGFSAITLAEIGQLFFFVAYAVFGDDRTKRNILAALITLTMAYAIVGNWVISQPLQHGAGNSLGDYFSTAWDLLETLGPPIVVMGIGFVLKDLGLRLIKAQYESSLADANALANWNALRDDPESSHSWQRVWSLTIWDELRQIHKSKTWLNEITKEERAWLVKQELLADQWLVDANTITEVEINQRIQDTLDNIKPAALGDSGISKRTKRAYPPEVWQNPEDGLWYGRSTYDGFELTPGRDKKESAYMAIIRHDDHLLNAAKARMTPAAT